mmetsp:Transcript_146896/g.259620  ORF Transcript_146896/g.259620 Transcript_146896/m.259620 type:complete len:150 (-) Transcript_146896:119-568(-)
MPWLPDWLWKKQKGKGGGGGKGGGWGGGKGGGWKSKGGGFNKKFEGNSNLKRGGRREGAIIGKASKEGKVVWIGGIPEQETKSRDVNKELLEFVNANIQGGKCKYIDIRKNGQGAAVFDSPLTTKKAIQTLNGTQLMGVTLKFDKWVQQ